MNVCEGIVEYVECLNVLKTFQEIKSPGNDSFTVMFYLLWRAFG